MSIRKSNWLDWAVEQAHPHLKTWYSRLQLEANLTDQLEIDLDRLEHLDEGFERNMPVTGATPAMYNHRVYELAGMQVVLGIRFRGGDITIPFVDLVRSSGPITSAAQVEAICDLVRQEFAVFKPLRVRFYQPAHLEFQIEVPGSSGDKRVLAAPLTSMLAQPKPDGLERVALRRTHDLEFYPRYAETYAAAYQERPWLPVESSTHSLEDMQEYLEIAQVYEIFVDGQFNAGVIGTDTIVSAVAAGGSPFDATLIRNAAMFGKLKARLGVPGAGAAGVRNYLHRSGTTNPVPSLEIF